MRCKTWFALLLSIGASAASATDGDLFTAFGNGGFAISDNAIPFESDVSRPVLQPDGKVLVCDTRVPVGASWDFILTRFTSGGSPDPTFGTDGHVIVDFDGADDNCDSIAVQTDGKIVAVGGSSPTPGSRHTLFAIARMNADGSMDSTFGAGSGKVTLSFGTDSNEMAGALAAGLQADGKIVVAGAVEPASNNYDFAAVRLLPDGSLDSTFGSNGKTTVAFDLPGSGNKADHFSAMTIDGAGKILLAGYSSANANNANDFSIARLDTSGQLDVTFGVGGRTTVAFDVGFGKQDKLWDLALQRDGRIVMAGSADTSPGPTPNLDIAVARLLPDGQPDPAFGNAGKTVIAFDQTPGGADSASGVAVQSDGKLLLVGIFGSESGYAAAMRLDPAGALDPTFGVLGKKVYAPPALFHSANFWGVAVRDGRIFVSGQIQNSGTDAISEFVAKIDSELIFSDTFE